MSHSFSKNSKLKSFLVFLSFPIGLLLAFNLFWLQFSTTRITVGPRGVAEVQLHINNEIIEIGNLRRGESRFMFLPKGEERLYMLTYSAGDHRPVACEVTVKDSGNHVETTLYGDKESVCVVSEPMLSGLMITKFF